MQYTCGSFGLSFHKQPVLFVTGDNLIQTAIKTSHLPQNIKAVVVPGCSSISPPGSDVPLTHSTASASVSTSSSAPLTKN